jgi:hypothetical protein
MPPLKSLQASAAIARGSDRFFELVALGSAHFVLFGGSFSIR